MKTKTKYDKSGLNLIINIKYEFLKKHEMCKTKMQTIFYYDIMWIPNKTNKAMVQGHTLN